MGAESRQELARELELLRSQAGREVVQLKRDLNVRRRVRLSYQAHQGVFVLGAVIFGFLLGIAGTVFKRRNSLPKRKSFWSAPATPTPAATGGNVWAVVLAALHFLSGMGRPLIMAWAKRAFRPGLTRSSRRDGFGAGDREFAQTIEGS